MINLKQGDCLIEHKHIKDGSVDLILTDLPYGTIKGLKIFDYNGGVEWDVVVNTDEIMSIANRTLRKNGKMVLFAQEPFTTELITKAISNVPFNYRMIWEKDTFANNLSSNKAPVSYYEDILVFSKNHDCEGLHPLREYFKMVMAYIGLSKKEIIDRIGQRADHTFRTGSTQFALCTENTYNELIQVFGIDKMEGFKTYEELKRIDDQLKSTFNLWQGKKHKSNILKYSKDYNSYHPTQKPIALLSDLILTFSNENDLVVDLTMGSGSTGVACVKTNRGFFGIELDKDYFKIAENRIMNEKRQLTLF